VGIVHHRLCGHRSKVHYGEVMLGGFLAKIKWVEFMDQKDARAARGSKSNLKTFKIKITFENIMDHFTLTN